MMQFSVLMSVYKSDKADEVSSEGRNDNGSCPLISVVMPNYNGARFVEEAIRSVLNQTYRNIELLIIDDCSSDSSPELIDKLARDDNRIKLIRQKENSGVSVVRNIGIKEAKGEYIALIDNDDTWEPDKLERQLKIALKGAEIVYCSYDFINENGESIKRPFIVPPKTNFRSMLSSSVISCSTAFVRSDLLKEHPFIPDFYHEDYVLWMELLRLPVKAMGDQKVLMHYRQSSGSRSNKKANAAKERWNTYRKALNLSLPVSVWSFLCYSVKGFIKYYC